ncbi:MAG: TRAP transporter large permease [Clostridiales Family XIII bacterium]|nr:TRAP transporter large permease [Clostridiales Family XIII bacterium]
MSWVLVVIILLGVLIAMMLSGMPIALVFMAIISVGSVLFWGDKGLDMVVNGMYSGLANFTLVPIALFILMGEVLFHSGVGPMFMSTLDMWMGRVPGRLSLLSVAGGVLFAVLTGASVASVAMLTGQLVPEMEKRKYHRYMSFGPILGSGGLAVMIPPSGLAILLGVLGEISVRSILMAIIIPGILMALIMAIYIIVRCSLQPHLAPTYTVPKIPLKEKLTVSVKTLLPVAFVIFLVTGVIVLGVCTPTEASATGAIGMFIIAALYRKLNWSLINKCVLSSLKVVCMMMSIIACAKVFSGILSFSGVSNGLARSIIGLEISEYGILAIMMAVVLLMGMFMDSASIMMITLPIFMPIVHALGFSPVWFAVIFLISVEIGLISPPFGLSLFVLMGMAPKGSTVKEIYMSVFPFIGCHVLSIIIIVSFPMIALWLPNSV